MRYPNQRYAYPDHLKHYTDFYGVTYVAKVLKRDERTVKNWLSGRVKLPFWVPELLRLRDYEAHQQLRYMGIPNHLARLGVVHGKVIDFPDQFAVKGRLAKLDEANARPDPIKEQNDRIIKELKAAAG